MNIIILCMLSIFTIIVPLFALIAARFSHNRLMKIYAGLHLGSRYIPRPKYAASHGSHKIVSITDKMLDSCGRPWVEISSSEQHTNTILLEDFVSWYEPLIPKG